MTSPTDLSALYGDGARELQDHLDSRRLADRMKEVIVHSELSDDDIEVIRAQSTVWVSTVDAQGWPDVSYKGGDVGFVEVASPTEIRIPSYDGNGMMRSLGNVVDTGRVALLFVDTARPWRLRVHATARVSTELADIERHLGATAVLIVTIGRIFPNCGRYIHQDGDVSPNVPREGIEAPIPGWKSYDIFSDVLPE